MALLKSYSCVKCGGVLNFDEGQEVFGCPFCGGEFAFTDFHRGDLIKQGKMALNRGNYLTAKDKYQAILRRNPRDFEALLGLILAECHLPSVGRVCRLEYLENARLKEAIQATKNAKEALPEETEYFDLLIRLFELADEYNRTRDDADEVTKAQNKHFRNMGYDILTIEEKEAAFFDSYKKSLWYIASRILPFVVLFLIAFDLAWVNILIFAGLILLSVGLKQYFVIRKKRAAKRLDREMADQSFKDNADIVKMRNLRDEYMNTYYKIKKIVPDPKAYEQPAPAVKNDAPEADPFIDIEKTVICNKCGGLLNLDKEKRLYECRSCGVAYGTSLFFGDPYEKIANALKDNDFAEADQRLSYMLMQDPHNFDALLGRTLLAGRWKKISDIVLTEQAFQDVRMNSIKARIADAVAHSAEEDRPFIENMSRLISLLIDYQKASQAVDTFNEELEKISRFKKSGQNSKDGIDVHPENESDYIMWRREELLRKQNLKTEFEELKEKILSDYKELRSCGSEDKKWQY